jgi:RNA polymerase sigma-70 factor (ECF subfamily)
LSTWIAQIAYNTCFTYLEKKRLVLTGDRPDENEWDDAIIDNSVTGTTGNPIESMIFEKERAAAISIAIEKLSPLYKTLITLYHNEELSYKEIGEITTLPEGTIKSYLFRARKELKESLLQQYKKGEL